MLHFVEDLLFLLLLPNDNERCILASQASGLAACVHGHELGGTNSSRFKALGCGNCALAPDTPFNREALGDGYGILYQKDAKDLRQKMQDVVDHPEMRDRYAAHVPGCVGKTYTWEHTADQYKELLRRMTAKRQ